MELRAFFTQHPRVALAFSGGVDSAYLLYAALQSGAQVCAYYVKSPFQPQFELNDARRLAAQLQAEMKVLDLDVLAVAEVAANPGDRCYYCKRAIFSAIGQAAAADGYTVLLDGTNASDDESDRPGIRALRELRVLSPLRLCGLTKPEIRSLSRAVGLFTWNKPAYACLATRIPSGEPITPEKLQRTEAAEDLLFTLGLSDFRVRLQGTAARLQVPALQFAMLLQHKETIVKEFKKYYSAVLLDLEGRD